MKLLSPRNWTLNTKLALTITAVVAGVSFTIGAVIVALDSQRFHDELGAKAVLLARSVAVTSPDSVLRNDAWSLFTSLKRMASGYLKENDSVSHIHNAMILSPEGDVLSHLQPSMHPLGLRYDSNNEMEQALLEKALAVKKPAVLVGGGGEDGFLEGVVPFFSDDKFLGVVRVQLSTEELYLKTQRSGFIVLGLTFCLVLLGSILGVGVSRYITKPLTEITNGLEAATRGDFTSIKTVPVVDNAELGRLADSFNKMASEMVEKKKLEEQIAMSEKLVVLGRITAGVAHEVNNPLGGLLNCVNTLKKHASDPNILERYLPLLEKGLNRIKGIVGGLLFELKVEERTEVSDPLCLDEIKELVETEVKDRNIVLAWNNRLTEDVRFNGPRVQQIIHNLLKNAFEALPQGGNVYFSSHQEGDQLIFEVNDDGPGIPVNHRSHLFDPFFSTKTNGTGLGLWIVYRLVESMQGIINVESEIDRGTHFIITLPIMEAGR